MKLHYSIYIMLSVGLLLTVSSCDKVSDLAGKAKDMTKGLVGSDDEEDEEVSKSASVEPVDEGEGKAIIKEEARLVVVEFYSDT